MRSAPVCDDDLVDVGEPDQALLHEGLALGDLELLHDEALEAGRHGRFHLEPDDRSALAPLQRRFEQAHQILGLFLDLDIAVTHHPERALAPHPVAGKQTRHEDADHGLQSDEANVFHALLARQPDEAVELRGDRQQRVHGAQAALAHELEPEREAEIRDEGERMGRIDGDRREHGKDQI